MSIETWGDMNKSQIDNTLIETRISEMIQEHNDDPTAHMADDQSIGQHRINDVIDHPAFSVVDDKLFLTRYTLTPPLNSVDGWNLNGSVVAGVSNITLFTTNTVNNSVRMYMGSDDVVGFAPNPSKNPSLEVTFAGNLRGTAQCYIAIGDISSDFGIGFYITETGIYARHNNNAGDYIDQLLTTFANFTVYKVKVVVFHHSHYDFYINDILVYRFTCVSGDDSLSPAYPIFIMAKTTQTNKAVDFCIYGMSYQQDL